MSWIISYPCWGAEGRALGLDGPLDSILQALIESGIKDARFVIATDEWQWFMPFVAKCPYEVQFYAVPDLEVVKEMGLGNYHIFGWVHRHALDLAKPGDRVAMMCGDTTVSVDSFASAERIFQGGKRLILCPGTSTIGRAPITTASKLLDWTLQKENMTPMCQSLFWKEGHAPFPYMAYFRHARGIDFRAFHLHPFAVVKSEGLTFGGITSDVYLSQEIPIEDVHVVKTPYELALAERSPADRRRGWAFRKVGAYPIVAWATSMSLDHGMRQRRHLWHFSNQITLQGEPDPTNQAIADAIIARIEKRWSQEERWLEKCKRLRYPFAVAPKGVAA